MSWWWLVPFMVGVFIGRLMKLYATHKLAARLERIVERMEELKAEGYGG